jgi:hypothetical protein
VKIDSARSMNKSIVMVGDILAIAVLTLIGFASHGEAQLSFLPRMAALFFPFSISWFLLAPALGLFNPETVFDPRQLWRSGLAAFFAATLAAVLRGFLLGSPIIPIFAAVLAGVSSLAMVIWRGLYLIWNLRSRRTLRP